MNPLGHVGIAAVAFAPILRYVWSRGERRSVAAAGLVAATCAVAPDVDLYVAWLTHRGLTHTVWAAVAGGFIVGGVAGACGTGGRRGCFYGVLGVLGILLHLVGDVVTPMGLRPLSPVDGWDVTLSLVLSRDPTANLFLFVAGVSAVTLALGGGARVRLPWPSVRGLVR